MDVCIEIVRRMRGEDDHGSSGLYSSQCKETS